MADQQLQGLRVAILATDGVEQVELLEPREALNKAGADTKVISPKPGKIKGWNHTEWGEQIPVDIELSNANPKTSTRCRCREACRTPTSCAWIPQRYNS